jgi:hypothetical protein
MGKYGPMAQIGDEELDGEKPVFASLLKNQSIHTITIEEVLELYKLPRVLGVYEDVDVKANIGRFGPYVQQSKLFVSLPSKGIYNKAGSIQGDPEKIAVFGMTGADEILMKTPDTLLTGESTVKVFESCCPAIKDGWDLCSLDTDVLLAAIRIATNGNTVTVSKICEECEALNDYDIDLSDIVDHFANCKYESKIVVDSLVIKIQPLTYKQTSEYSIKNFIRGVTITPNVLTTLSYSH